MVVQIEKTIYCSNRGDKKMYAIIYLVENRYGSYYPIISPRVNIRFVFLLVSIYRQHLITLPVIKINGTKEILHKILAINHSCLVRSVSEWK